MQSLLLLSLAAVAFSLTSMAEGAPLEVLSAPNLLHVGLAQNIFVECQDCSGGDQTVLIQVLNFPTRSQMLSRVSVTLTAQDNFQGFGKVTIPAEDFNIDPYLKQYVYVEAQFPSKMLQKIVLISFQSRDIFIQTDKPIYTPGSKVNFGLFEVTPNMQPREGYFSNHGSDPIAIDLVTPENVVLNFLSVHLMNGIYIDSYKLPEPTSTGVWKLQAKLLNNPKHSFSAEFEVKEYVLPSFEVKLTADRSVLHVNDDQLIINIKATYLFGEHVKGTAYVLFGVSEQNTKKSLLAFSQIVQLTGGVGVAVLKREAITKTFNIQQLMESHSSIYVSVSVLTETDSELVEAELRGIQIVTSPYTIDFTKTPKYFKPGMPFNVVVNVLNSNESPASGIGVVINPGDVMGMTSVNGLARLTINTLPTDTQVTITAKTTDRNIQEDRQARAEMTALPYRTTSHNYLHIDVGSTEVTVGSSLNIVFHVMRRDGNPVHDVTYLIQSRGQLVKYGTHKRPGQGDISMTLSITKYMLPSFRIIAYYNVNANEVVSDAIWVDVKDTCIGSLKLELTGDKSALVPRRSFGLKVTGDPGARVTLVAVDKGVFVLNNKGGLTQKKVWDTVEQHDTGYTPGGGKDSMGVFVDAGLMFETMTASGTPYRLSSTFPQPARGKRATTTTEVVTSLGSENGRTITRRHLANPGGVGVNGSAPVDHDSTHYIGSEDIYSRTRFPESWLRQDLSLPECPAQTPYCGQTSVERRFALPESITTWQFFGISVSTTHGICVADPFEATVAKMFFIDLRLPYSAVRGEQLEIVVILHNYLPNSITVRVDLLETAHVCISSSKNGKNSQEVDVEAESESIVLFAIRPMEIGYVSIEVKAAVKDDGYYDGIRKLLQVVPQGLLTKSQVTETLEPSKQGGTQVSVMISAFIPQKDIIPNTPAITTISITGHQTSMFVEKAISGTSMGSLIDQPAGNGAGNMFHMTLPVIATTYLDKTNQWETVGFKKRSEALIHIVRGYNNYLTTRKPDGSFAVAIFYKSSSWLTAYVAKVFAMASQLMMVDQNIICNAIKWLFIYSQLPDGSFMEVGKTMDGEMIGVLPGLDSDASLTAFILIAMQESQTCTNHISIMSESQDKAVGYLERRLPSLKCPYAIAMTSYALANANKLNKSILYSVASKELDHWPVPGSPVYTLEATAYALLALVKVKAFREASAVVKWLNNQNKIGGGYGYTQVTMMVYQAVGEYWENVKNEQHEIVVEVQVLDRLRPEVFHFNNKYAFTRSFRFPRINQNVTVTATGTGEATIEMASLYYSYPEGKMSDCKKFNLSVDLLPARDTDTYKLRMAFLYLDMDRDASMSILDIRLPTGFTVNTDDLDLLHQGPDRVIARYEMDKLLSASGSLIIYLDKVSHTRPEEIAFRVTKTIKVGHVQPAAVSIYENDDQTRCVKYYRPETTEGKLCSGTCACFEENCSKQKKQKIDDNLRISLVCGGENYDKIEFVYKVRLEGFANTLQTDSYSMRIEQVIKEGYFDIGSQGKLRVFLSQFYCREALGLQTGKTYLIMGTHKDVYKNIENQQYEYILTERMWVEYWPSSEECRTDVYLPICPGIEKMVKQYELFGCFL